MHLPFHLRTLYLLQNLVVKPIKGGKLEIIYRALRVLFNHGKIDDTYEVPCDIRKRTNKDQRLRIATVDNIQREQPDPNGYGYAQSRYPHGGSLENGCFFPQKSEDQLTVPD